MGCCVSTNKPSTSSKKHNVGSESLSLQKTSFSESRAPPPSVEEETVKEVLSSETPKLKPPQVSFSETLKPKPHFPVPQQQEQDKKTHNPPVFDNKINKTKDDISVSLSEVSETCSVSLSESVSTTTITDCTRDFEEEEEVKQKLVARSPAKLLQPPRNRVGDRVVGKSPTRISDKSPNKRNGSGSVRLVHQSRGGELGHGIVRRGSRPDPNRREPGESSVRRSRSPATNRSVMGGSPSVRRTNRSPGRVRLDQAESSNNMEVKWPQSNSATTNESLENPLVSLECFIFL